MKKILALAVALSATALMACPMGQGMMGNSPMCGGGMMDKCQCDARQLPHAFEALDLSDKQKEQIIQLREEEKAFHNKQREKMMAVLNAEQKGKLDYARKLKELRMQEKGSRMMGGMGMEGGMGMTGGMGCKQCPNK